MTIGSQTGEYSLCLSFLGGINWYLQGSAKFIIKSPGNLPTICTPTFDFCPTGKRFKSLSFLPQQSKFPQKRYLEVQTILSKLFTYLKYFLLPIQKYLYLKVFLKKADMIKALFDLKGFLDNSIKPLKLLYNIFIFFESRLCWYQFILGLLLILGD